MLRKEPTVQVTPRLTAFAKAMAVEESYGAQVSDTTKADQRAGVRTTIKLFMHY